jgi:hypothetical protein
LTYFRWLESDRLLAYHFMDPQSGTALMLEISVLLNSLLTDAVLIWWLAKELTAFFVPRNATWLADLCEWGDCLFVHNYDLVSA